MKKFILLFIILIASNTYATDWKLSTSVYKTTAMDSEAVVQGGYGLQAALHCNSGYIYASRDVIPIRFGGQRGVDISLWSAGLGIQHKIGKYLSISCDAGWYEPMFEEEGVAQIFRLEDGTHAPQTHLAEGLWLYLNDFWAMNNRDWDYYTLNYQGGIGGKLSLSFECPISDWFLFEMTTGYQHLRLIERIRGKDYGNDVSFWVLKQDRDFSSWTIGVCFVILF